MSSNDQILLLALIALIAVLVYGIGRRLARLSPTTVFDFQAGLLYRNGAFERLLGAGRYWLLWPNQQIVVTDLREQSLMLFGQEMLTSDNLSVRASLVVRYRITDPVKAHTSTAELGPSLHREAQVALRKTIAALRLEEVLGARSDIARTLQADLAPTAQRLGLEIAGADLLDLMLQGPTRQAFADIFRARKEGEAALERARGETAALRNLANGARLLKEHPALFDLRLLQAVSTSAAKGATVVLNASGEGVRVVPSSEPRPVDPPAAEG